MIWALPWWKGLSTSFSPTCLSVGVHLLSGAPVGREVLCGDRAQVWWQPGLWGRVITLCNCKHLELRRGTLLLEAFSIAQDHTRRAGSSVALSKRRIHQDPKGHAALLNRRYILSQPLSGRNCNQVFKHVSCRSDHRKEYEKGCLAHVIPLGVTSFGVHFCIMYKAHHATDPTRSCSRWHLKIW